MTEQQPQQPTKDRNYYRCLTNAELIEAAKRDVNPDWQELALVLSERLDAQEREYDPRYCPTCDQEV